MQQCSRSSVGWAALRRHGCVVAHVLVCLILLAFAVKLNAATVTWTNTSGDGLWSDATNWSGGSPTGNDLVFANSGSASGSGIVTSVVDSSQTINSLAFSNSSGLCQDLSVQSGQTLNISGRLSVLTGDANAFIGGSDSAINADSLIIKYGTLTVQAATTLNAVGGLAIGDDGTGALTLMAGAGFTVGTAVSPTFMYVGYNGTATFAPNSSTNPNISMNVANLTVGTYGGTGTLDLSNYSGTLNANALYIGSFGGNGATGVGHVILGGKAYSIPSVAVDSGGLTLNAGATLNVPTGIVIGGEGGTGALTMLPGAGLTVGSASSPAYMYVGYNGTGSFSPNSTTNPNISINVVNLAVGTYGGTGTLDLSNFTGTLNANALYIGTFGGNGASGVGHVILGRPKTYSIPVVEVDNGGLTVNSQSTLNVGGSLQIGGYGGTASLDLAPDAGMNLGLPDRPMALYIGSTGSTATFAPNSSSNPNLSIYLSALTLGIGHGEGTLDLTHYTGPMSIGSVSIGSGGTGHLIFGNAINNSLTFPTLTINNGDISVNSGAALCVTSSLILGYDGSGTINLASGAGLHLGTPGNPISIVVGYTGGTTTFAPKSSASANLSIDASTLYVGLSSNVNGTVDLSAYTGELGIGTLSIGCANKNNSPGTGHFIFGNSSLNNLSVPIVLVNNGDLTVNSGATLSVTSQIFIGAEYNGTGAVNLAPGAGIQLGTSTNPIAMSIGFGGSTGTFAPNSASNPNVSIYLSSLTLGTRQGAGNLDLTNYTGPLSISSISIGSGATGHFTFGNAVNNSITFSTLTINNGDINVNSGASLSVTSQLFLGADYGGTGAINLAPGAGLNLGTAANPIIGYLGYQGSNAILSPNSSTTPNVSMYFSSLTLGTGQGGGTLDLTNCTGPVSIGALWLGDNATGHFIFGNSTLKSMSIPSLGVYNGDVTVNSGATLSVTNSLLVGYNGLGSINLAPGAGLHLGAVANPISASVGQSGTATLAVNSAVNPNVAMYFSQLYIGEGGGAGTVDMSNYTGPLGIGSLIVGDNNTNHLGAGHFIFGNSSLNNLSIPQVSIQSGDLTVNAGAALSVSSSLVMGYDGTGAIHLAPGAELHLGAQASPISMVVGYTGGTTTFAPNSATNPDQSIHASTLYIGFSSNVIGTVDLSAYTGELSIGTLSIGCATKNNSPGTGHFIFGNSTLNSLSIPTVQVNNGDLTVNTGAALSVTGSLTVGNTGSAAVDLSSGADLRVIGTATLSGGGTLATASSSMVDGSGTVSVAGGTLNINGRWSVGGVTSITSGTATFSGGVYGPVGVNGGTTVFAGGGTGALAVNGGLATFASPSTLNGFSAVNLSGGTTTVSAGGMLNAISVLITGGAATVQGGSSGGALLVGNGSAGIPALTMTAQTLTLNADAAGPGRLVLNGDVAFANTSGTASIVTSAVGVGQIAGTVDLNGGVHTLAVANGGTALITARMTNGGFNKDGLGTLVLGGNTSNLAGGITILEGTLQMAAPSQISGGIDVSFEGPNFGTLSVDSDGQLGTASNTVTLAGGTLLATSSFSTSRSITLGDSGGNGNGTVSVNPSVTLTANGPVSGLAGLIKQGSGTLILNGSLSYTGATKVQAGTLTLGPGVTLPAQSVVSVAPGATLDMSTQSNRIAALQDTGGGSGNVTLGSATLTVGSLGASTIFSGNINGSTGGAIIMSGAGSMALTGSLTNFTGGASVTQGTMLLAGSANTFTGGVSASHGTLSVASDGALGNAANAISLSSGGMLAVTNSFATARHLSLGNNGGTVEVGPSVTLIDSGSLTGSTSLTLNGTAGTAGGGGMLNITSAEAFSGSLTIDGSSPSAGAFDTTLLLSGSGTMDNLSALSLVRQGTLELYDAGGLTTGRLGISTQLNLSGGTLSIMGPASGMASESLGKLNLSQGSSIIDLIDGSSGTVELTFASYTRKTGAQVYFEMSPSDQVLFTSMPAGLINGMTLVEDGLMGHAQYDPTSGVEFFGATTPSTAFTPSFALIAPPSPVPEPSAMGMIALTSVAAFSRRRSGKSTQFS